MNAFDNIKPTNMPLQDADKDTDILLGEIKSGVPGNLTAIHAKLDELIDNRIVMRGDVDDIVIGDAEVNRGGIRPKHAPIVPA